jgi:hypothetical protein
MTDFQVYTEVEDMTMIISKELNILELWISQSLRITVNAFLLKGNPNVFH